MLANIASNRLRTPGIVPVSSASLVHGCRPCKASMGPESLGYWGSFSPITELPSLILALFHHLLLKISNERWTK